MRFFKTVFILFFIAFNCQIMNGQVHAVSEMRKVMMGTDLSAHLLWDSIPHEHLFGISPLGRIQGEITIIDGKPFVATVANDGTIHIKEDWKVEAPFGVFTHVKEWQKFDFNETISDETDLQNKIEAVAKAQGYDISKPFPFRIFGDFTEIGFHIISKPIDEKEHDHDLHDKAKKHFSLKNIKGELLGFYSQNHQGVFTHRGSFIHTHFIDDAHKNMGHLEEIKAEKGKLTLLFPRKNDAQGALKTTNPTPSVFAVGSMQDMGKDNFAPHIQLDTIANKTHLYGMGPYGKMQGEITVFDGKPMFATAFEPRKALISQKWQMGSPFFVSANVANWQVFELNEAVTDMASLQKAVATIAEKNGYDLKTAFPFRIKGSFDTMTTHIVTPRSADIQGFRANVKQEDFTETNASGELLGFYSENHQGIFTGKNSFIHVHFISDDATMMAHLDKITISKKVLNVYLPLKANISVNEAFDLAEKNTLLIDVREAEEVAEKAYKVKNMRNIPLSNIENRLQEIPRNEPIIIACRTGNKSKKVYDLLKKNGFSNMTNMEGGIVKWQEINLPIISKSTPPQYIKVNDTDFSKGRLGNIQNIDLEDLTKLHGHLCDGLVVGYQALNEALKMLYPDGIIDRTNTRIVSKPSPCLTDVAVYLTGGRYQFNTFYVNKNIEGLFIVQRIDNGKAVSVSLNKGVKPAEIDRLGKLAETGALDACGLDNLKKLEDDFSTFLLKNDPQKHFTIKEITDFKWKPKLQNNFIKTDILNKNKSKCSH